MFHSEAAEMFLDSIPSIIVDGTTGDMLFANKPAEVLFGYDNIYGEMLTLNVDALLPLAMQAGHFEYRKKFSSDPKVRLMGERKPVRGKRKNGTEFPARVHLVPGFVAHRKVVGAQVFVIVEEEGKP